MDYVLTAKKPTKGLHCLEEKQRAREAINLELENFGDKQEFVLGYFLIIYLPNYNNI